MGLKGKRDHFPWKKGVHESHISARRFAAHKGLKEALVKNADYLAKKYCKGGESEMDPEIEAKLQQLRESVQTDVDVGEMLFEYIRRRQQGEVVDHQEVINQVSSTAVREKLAELLPLTEALLELGKWYREKRRSEMSPR